VRAPAVAVGSIHQVRRVPELIDGGIRNECRVAWLRDPLVAVLSVVDVRKPVDERLETHAVCVFAVPVFDLPGEQGVDRRSQDRHRIVELLDAPPKVTLLGGHSGASRMHRPNSSSCTRVGTGATWPDRPYWLAPPSLWYQKDREATEPLMRTVRRVPDVYR